MTVKELMMLFTPCDPDAEVVIYADGSEVTVASIAAMGRTKVEILPQECLVVEQPIDAFPVEAFDDEDCPDEDDTCEYCGLELIACQCGKHGKGFIL